MEKYLNDTLTPESKLKADNLSKVDLMPQAIKDWYVRHSNISFNTSIDYNTDELSNVWDMEMLPDGSQTIVKKVDTLTKDTSTKSPITPTTPPITNNKIVKDSILPKKTTLPKPKVKKIKSKQPIKKNVNHI